MNVIYLLCVHIALLSYYYYNSSAQRQWNDNGNTKNARTYSHSVVRVIETEAEIIVTSEVCAIDYKRHVNPNRGNNLIKCNEWSLSPTATNFTIITRITITTRERR